MSFYFQLFTGQFIKDIYATGRNGWAADPKCFRVNSWLKKDDKG